MGRTFIIAEAGSTHDMDFMKATELCVTAFSCGADAVKFQYWSDSKRLASRRHHPELADAYEQYRIPAQWVEELKIQCGKIGIEFMCTCYLPEDLDFISRHVGRFKISAFEASDTEFVKAHQKYGKETFISIAMCDMKSAQSVIPKGMEGILRPLHCVSAYPPAVNQLNLSCIRNGFYGFSDNGSLSELTGAFAVACGAKAVEVHFRHDRTYPDNPDYHHSISGGRLRGYIDNIRKAEMMLGDGIKRQMPCEEKLLPFRV